MIADETRGGLRRFTAQRLWPVPLGGGPGLSATNRPPAGPIRTLVVLDRPSLAEVVRTTLGEEAYVTRSARTAHEVTTMLSSWRPHLAILDMDRDAAPLMRALSEPSVGEIRLPVIGLTRGRELQATLTAFDLGADDVVSAPFAPEELRARVAALVRRSYVDSLTFLPIMKLGELEIDILHRKVRDGVCELHLTSLEQSLLYLLAANAGRVVGREEILDALWGVDYVAESNVVDRQIRNLRAALRDDWRQPRFIATVPGRGYRFVSTWNGDSPREAAS